jgi:hypothetical protein
VEYNVVVAHRLADQFPIGDGAEHNVRQFIRLENAQIPFGGNGQRIEHGYVVSHREQGLGQVTALKARSSSYENSRHLPLPVECVLCRILATGPAAFVANAKSVK